MPSIKSVITATVVLVSMDLLWIGVIMSDFYQSHLRPLLNFVDGSLQPRIIPTIITYVTMIVLVTCVALPLAKTYGVGSNLTTFAIGAFLGILVYGLYNFTNLSLLKDWDWSIALVDTLWGGVIFGTATLVSFLVG